MACFSWPCFKGPQNGNSPGNQSLPQHLRPARLAAATGRSLRGRAVAFSGGGGGAEDLEIHGATAELSPPGSQVIATNHGGPKHVFSRGAINPDWRVYCWVYLSSLWRKTRHWMDQYLYWTTGMRGDEHKFARYFLHHRAKFWGFWPTLGRSLDQ